MPATPLPLRGVHGDQDLVARVHANRAPVVGRGLPLDPLARSPTAKMPTVTLDEASRSSAVSRSAALAEPALGFR